LLLIEQEMEVDPKQQIEEELRRVLHLKQEQPPLNSRQPEGSHCVSYATSLPSGDVQCSYVGSPSVASSPPSTVNVASPAGAAEKIPTASLSSPSVNHLKQAAHGNESSRCRKPRQSKQNSPRNVPHDAVGVAGSQKSALEVKPESPRMDTSEMATTIPADITSASSALYAGLCASGSSSSTIAGINSSNNVRTATKTFTNQRGGKAARGRATKKQTDVYVPTVPGRSLDKPKSEHHIRVVSTSRVGFSERLSSTDSDITGNVKSETQPVADENVTHPSSAPVAKIVENVQLPVNKHEKGKVCIQ